MSDIAPNKSLCMNQSCMNGIVDDLLLEIFCRLPSAESVMTCKCVCKLWFNLTSGHEFAVRFISHKITGRLENRKKEDENDEQPDPIIFIQRPRDDAVICPPNHAFASPKFSLSFIGGEEFPSTVKAWDRDLILCSNFLENEFHLYVCNPRTKQFLQLPPPPHIEGFCLFGFTCDPYYRFDTEVNTPTVTVNTACQFTVCYVVPTVVESVIWLGAVTRLEMEIFSSETRVWRKVILLSPEAFNYNWATLYNSNFTLRGILHFYTKDAIVAFDPNMIDEDGTIYAHYIEMPVFETPDGGFVSIGVFGDRIRMVQYCVRRVYQQGRTGIDLSEVSIEPQNNVHSFKVWELQDYVNGKWSLEYTTYVRDLISEDHILNEHIKLGCPNSYVCCFKPNDLDTVLLQLAQQIVNGELVEYTHVVECNLREKTLKSLCQVPVSSQLYGLSLTWWPSPLPKCS